jgi:putative acetyltransferase
MVGLDIRSEQPGDVQSIHALVKRAFATQPHADGDEQDLIDRLRQRGELSLSLVASLPGPGIVGHIGFSPAWIDGQDRGWFQMAPVSVEPAFHRQGIGGALIRAGIVQLQEQRAHGIGVVGDPAYYERFGFQDLPGLAPVGPDAVYFRAIAFGGPAPRGVVSYASAFG